MLLACCDFDVAIKMHSIDRSVLDWAEQMDEHTTVSA